MLRPTLRSLLCAAALVLFAAPAAQAQDDWDPEWEPGWMDFELEGVHAFAGVAGGAGVSGHWIYDHSFDTETAGLFTIRGGVLLGDVELAAELAPKTFWSEAGQPGMLTFNLSVGGLPELADSVHWPLRFGVGLADPGNPNGDLWLMGRVDLIGIAYRLGHVIFELNLPSIRFQSDLEHFGIWGWVVNLGVTYVI